MRIFKDMELVEQLGSGIPRVLQTYGRESFKFSDNFVRQSTLFVRITGYTDLLFQLRIKSVKLKVKSEK